MVQDNQLSVILGSEQVPLQGRQQAADEPAEATEGRDRDAHSVRQQRRRDARVLLRRLVQEHQRKDRGALRQHRRRCTQPHPNESRPRAS